MAPSASYYVRVDIDDVSEGNPDSQAHEVDALEPGLELTFVDLHTRLRTPASPGISQIEMLTNAVQDNLHLCSRTDQVLFRWPWLGGPEDEEHVDMIDKWIERLTSADGGEPVLASGIRVGVIQHRVTSAPILCWGRGVPEDVDGILCSARAVEIETLLRRSNAIWEPMDYHYRLPSGEHTELFVRVADALNHPQDAYAIACWISERLQNEVGIVVDTGGLTPLILQLESFLTRFDRTIGPTAILEAYPAGRPAIRHTVESARSELSPGLVAILSVSSTGNLKNTLLDELDRAATSDGIDYTLDLIVDRSPTVAHVRKFSPDHSARSVPWFNLQRTSDPDASASCGLCRTAKKAPVVAVDPRTYGAMTLPRPHLVMPDVSYAEASHLFWECAAKSGGRAVEVNPHPGSRMARGKRIALPVRPIFERIGQAEGLKDIVRERWRRLVDEQRDQHDLRQVFGQTRLIIAAPFDIGLIPVSTPDDHAGVHLKEGVRQVLAGVGLDNDLPVLNVDDNEILNREIANLGTDDSVLLFSWGSVTGLTLRNMKLTIADALRDCSRERSVNGLVLQSRSSSPNEWTAQKNQFRPGILECLWASCFPWQSPLQDENRFLDRADIACATLSESASKFLRLRMRFLGLHASYADQEDDWTPRFSHSLGDPHPEHIFWGMSRDNKHQRRVRGRSLYGNELDCLTAYAAMGSTINYTRLNEHARAAPRWVVFDMGRIVRSYFDAVIICSVIRWLHPGELWWAERDDPESVRESVAFLLDQSADTQEQVLLVPELLLASAQGKVPVVAHDIVRDRAQEYSSQWPGDPAFDLARGAVEVGLQLLDAL